MRTVVAGNWKMNHGPSATADFLDRFRIAGGDAGGQGGRDETGGGGGDASGPRILLFPPALSLQAAVDHDGRDPGIELGVQNIHFEASGAYTGENSAPMARDAGATLALVGHSERRHVFGETDDEVARKIRAALDHGLVPVVCVGETLEERRAGHLEAVLHRQLDAALGSVGADDDWMLAYEPVWAIGTGETATPDDASGAHGLLRARMETAWDGPAATVPILYGGSVKPGNAADLLAAAEVNGVLVGGASLDPDSFAAIVEAARR